MRKTFEELVEAIRRPTTHYADQDFYDIDIEELLKLVRVKTLEECANADPGNYINSESIHDLPKDSIEI